MSILMYEVYAGYDLLDLAIISAIIATSGMVYVLLRDLWQDDFPDAAASGRYGPTGQ